MFSISKVDALHWGHLFFLIALVVNKKKEQCLFGKRPKRDISFARL